MVKRKSKWRILLFKSQRKSSWSLSVLSNVWFLVSSTHFVSICMPHSWGTRYGERGVLPLYKYLRHHQPSDPDMFPLIGLHTQNFAFVGIMNLKPNAGNSGNPFVHNNAYWQAFYPLQRFGRKLSLGFWYCVDFQCKMISTVSAYSLLEYWLFTGAIGKSIFYCPPVLLFLWLLDTIRLLTTYRI